uniref:Ig-like domain-containing protein n=1 Tax=Pundamilia nyererei TaxID=303518 RepID=A0A3B4H7S0_9CICH
RITSGIVGLNICLPVIKHSLKIFFMLSSGVPNTPDYVAAGELGGILIAYYDSNMKTLEPRQDWIRESMEDDPRQWETLIKNCKHYKQLLTDEIRSFKQYSNQTGGFHILQRIDGCELDENTGEVAGVLQYGHNGEDFLKFDLKTLKWIAQKPEAESIQQKWNADVAKNNYYKSSLTGICPQWLKKYLDAGKSSLQRREHPSVSLLQKTPSSPVSCHATGFYPDRAVMFWRKDGQKVHEGVDPGEILSNNDETFQMSVDLNVSSPEDWRRYECVMKEFLLTYKHIIVAVVVPVLLVLVLLILCAVGVVVYRRRRGELFK